MAGLAREIWLLKDKTTSNVSYLENVRKKPTEFAARLERLLDMTAQNKQFGGVEAKGML